MRLIPVAMSLLRLIMLRRVLGFYTDPVSDNQKWRSSWVRTCHFDCCQGSVVWLNRDWTLSRLCFYFRVKVVGIAYPSRISSILGHVPRFLPALQANKGPCNVNPACRSLLFLARNLFFMGASPQAPGFAALYESLASYVLSLPNSANHLLL